MQLFISFILTFSFILLSSTVIKNVKIIKEENKKNFLKGLLYKIKLDSYLSKVCISTQNNYLKVNNKLFYFENISSNFDEICFFNGKPNLQGSIYFKDIKISINFAGVFNVYSY